MRKKNERELKIYNCWTSILYTLWCWTEVDRNLDFRHILHLR